MITVEIKRENGEVIKMDGKACVSIVIGPEKSDAVSAVLMAGVTNPIETMRAIADTAASLLDTMCDDDLAKVYMASVMLRKFEQNMTMTDDEKNQFYETQRAEITPAE